MLIHSNLYRDSALSLDPIVGYLYLRAGTSNVRLSRPYGTKLPLIVFKVRGHLALQRNWSLLWR